MQAVINMARQSADGKDSIALNKIAMSDTYTVGIHLDEALANPGSTKDIELMDGDRLVIPRFNHTVRISGDVNAPLQILYQAGGRLWRPRQEEPHVYRVSEWHDGSSQGRQDRTRL